MVLSYLTWFSVELLHEYFNKDVLSDCRIMPAEDTKTYLKGSELLMRFIKNKLHLLIREEGNKPCRPVDQSAVFRFFITCSNPYFFNYSNAEKTAGKLYYFSNLSGNSVGSLLYLTTPVSNYQSTRQYQVGDFARDTVTGNIFQALIKNIGQPLALPAWQLRNNSQFVSAADLLDLTTPNFRFSFTAPVTVKKADVTVKGFRIDSGLLVEYTAAVHEYVFPEPVTEVQADMSSLPYGRYKVVINAVTPADVLINNEVTVYYDQQARQLPAMAVIEIFNHLPSANTHSLVNAAGEIRQTSYVIRFANRFAVWRYIAGSANVAAVTGAGGFTKNGQVFTSNVQLPFKQVPDQSVGLSLNNGPPGIKAPFPSASLLKFDKEADGTIRNYVTEIHLNY